MLMETGGEGKGQPHTQPTEVGTAEITPPCPVTLFIKEKEGGGNVPPQLLIYSALLQLAGAGLSPAVPCQETAALLEPVQNYATSLRMTLLPGHAGQLKILHIRCP